MRFYRYIQALSIDVALGSVIMTLWVARTLDVEMHWSITVTMGLCTWLVYTLDHLIDAKGLEEKAVTLRHSLHVKHFTSITYLWLAVLVLSLVVVVFWLPYQTVLYGLIALTIVAIHFVLVYLLGKKVSILVHKELGVGLAYAFGVFVGPMSCVSISQEAIFLFLSVLIIALMNLFLFSYFDFEADVKQGQTSIARGLGTKRSMYLVLFLGLLGVVLSSFELNLGDRGSFSILFLMIMGLASLVVFRNYFRRHDRYRVLGDGVFLFPVIGFLL